MDIEVTPEAAEVLRRGLGLAGLSPETAGVRLHVAKALGGGVRVQTEFADAPATGEETVECAGIRLFVDPSLTDVVPDPVVGVDPQHDRITVNPRG